MIEIVPYPELNKVVAFVLSEKGKLIDVESEVGCTLEDTLLTLTCAGGL
jgi:hypothetical protein